MATERPDATACIGLGSNLGDRAGALESARRDLEAGGCRIVARSSLYRTDPVEVVDQEEFVNQVVVVETLLSPRDLLELCLEIERRQGRVRTRAKGPRVIDLDLLLYGDRVLREPGLEVPHPRLPQRLFVLVPLAEIAPETRHPVLGLTVREILDRCPDRSRVQRIG